MQKAGVFVISGSMQIGSPAPYDAKPNLIRAKANLNEMYEILKLMKTLETKLIRLTTIKKATEKREIV